MHVEMDMNWEIINDQLPNNIILYKGYDSGIPVRAWAVVIPYKKQNKNKIKVLVSSDEDGLEMPETFALKTNAVVVINGGYFSRENPA